MSKVKPENFNKIIYEVNKIEEFTYHDEWRLYNPFAKSIQRKSQFLCCKKGHWGWTKTTSHNGYHIRHWAYYRKYF